jgi:hypothetical protein
MAGIGPAISKTGVTGGSKLGAKPGAVGANKNNAKVSKLSIADITDKEKEIKEGQDTGEVSKEENKDTGATTTKVDAEQSAKKAVGTPRDRLNSHLEEMGKRLDEHKANMDKGMMDAQNMAAQQQQGIDPAMLAAMQKPQQTPKSSGSSGGAKPQSRSTPKSSSNSDAARKLAESQKRMKDSFEDKLRSYEEKTSKTIAELKKENAKLKENQAKDDRVGEVGDRARRAAGTSDTENARSSGEDRSISQNLQLTREDIAKASDLLKAVRRGGGTPEQNKEILDNFDKIIGKLDDGEMKTNMQNIRDRFEEKSQIAENDPNKAKENNESESTRGELEDYDLNSFDPSNIGNENETQASTDTTDSAIDTNLDRDLERNIEETTDNATEQAEQQAQEMAEEQAEQEAQEELDRIVEEQLAEIEAELEEI